MYNNLCDFNRGDEQTMWCKVWKLNVPERVRTFTWLVLHNRLLTNSLKNVMGLGHAMCYYCRDVEETSLHVLRDCPLAKDLWYHVIPVSSRGAFFMQNFYDWINFNLNNYVPWSSTVSWCDIWAIVCHCLWTWRNKELHVEGYVRPVEQVKQVMNMVKDYMHASHSSNIVMGRQQIVSMIKWVPPKDNFIKINTDGAYKDNSIAGCGGVIRGSEGEWIGGFAKCVGMCNAFVAELWGVLEGLRFVRRLGFSRVELNIDSQAVVQAIKSKCSHSLVGGSLLKQIWRLLEMDWEVEVSHIYREANKCADALANIGCSLDYETLYYDVCPAQLSDLVATDSMGISTPRLIFV
jgi:ribonuclease HI